MRLTRLRSLPQPLPAKKKPTLKFPGSGRINTTSNCKWSGTPAALTRRSCAVIRTVAHFRCSIFKNGALAAADSINQAREHMLARKLLNNDVALSAAQAADLGFDLKSLN